MSRFLRGPLIIILVIVLVVVAVQLLDNPLAAQPDELEYNEFLNSVQENKIKDIVIQEYDVYGRYADTQIADDDFPVKYDFTARIPGVTQFNLDMAAITGSDDPLQYGFGINYIAPAEGNYFLNFLPYILMVLLLVFMFIFIMRQAKSGGAGGAMNFGKSRARMTNGGDTKKTFADVAGADEEKEELQ